MVVAHVEAGQVARATKVEHRAKARVVVRHLQTANDEDRGDCGDGFAEACVREEQALAEYLLAENEERE